MHLTHEDKQAISEAIEKAESLTSGEIVFAIADESGRYHQANLQGAIAGAALATAGYLLLFPPPEVSLLLWIEAVSLAVFYAIVPHLPLRRWFIRAREMDECVHEAAFREFYASGLYKTRDANGVLVYLSAFERRVVVMGDRGIHEKMGAQNWSMVRDTIISGIQRGRAREGICAAVEICGRTLAEHFPHRADDRNELSDAVIDRTRDSGVPGTP